MSLHELVFFSDEEITILLSFRWWIPLLFLPFSVTFTTLLSWFYVARILSNTAELEDEFVNIIINLFIYAIFADCCSLFF